MENSPSTDYERIKLAIEYLQAHFKEQPSLTDIASEIGLSPYHFQRLFSQWAGVSPKKFMQFLSLDYAKLLLKSQGATLLDATHETGLSSTSRLHDLFINIESMTPGDFKNGGEHLRINYYFSKSPFGKVIIASTPKGICHISFAEDETLAINILKKNFPKANYEKSCGDYQHQVMSIFDKSDEPLEQIKLHLKGTSFQLKIWEALLSIPKGRLATYKNIAQRIGEPTAVRAVGSAIGKNPVAFLIPCHRIIKSTGGIGGYKWGTIQKSLILGWEAAQTSQENDDEY